jgi:hypothetical protein
MTEVVWIPESALDARTKVYHTDRDCYRLQRAASVHRKTPASLPSQFRECTDCSGEADYQHGTTGEGHLDSLQEAAKSGFEIRADGGDA